jgi:hypothetical protein
LETARQRILYFIDSQKIKPKDFLEKTDLNKGFVDKSHQNSGISDLNLSKILEVYPNLNAHWLLTGKGEMLKSEFLNEEYNGAVVNEPLPQYSKKRDLEGDYIEHLKATLEDLRQSRNNLERLLLNITSK